MLKFDYFEYHSHTAFFFKKALTRNQNTFIIATHMIVLEFLVDSISSSRTLKNKAYMYPCSYMYRLNISYTYVKTTKRFNYVYVI